MAYIVLTVNLPNFSVQECNNRTIGLESTDSIKACENLLRGIIGGNYPANVEVTTRNTDPAVATDGGLSAQQNNNHL
jgi:hypothetical protein